jgi:nuclear pore complex protein Nup88
LDALHSSVEAVSARLRRHMHASKASQQQKKISGKKISAGDDQISILKSALEKLSLVNIENSKKVKIVESSLNNTEKISGESSLPRLKNC